MSGEAGSANTDDDAAVVWASKLESGTLTEDEAEALDAWLSDKPERFAALARARVAAALVVQTTTSEESRRFVTRRRLLSLALVAGGCALVGGGFLHFSKRQRYTTAIGEMGHVLLPDGSMTILNTDTEIALAFTPTARRVSLVRGEALFDVVLDLLRPFTLEACGLLVETHGASRPLAVSADHTRLGSLVDFGRDIARPLTQNPSRAGFEARGTTFSVRIRPHDHLETTVLEGAVDVRVQAQAAFKVPLKSGVMLTMHSAQEFQLRPMRAKSLENKLAWLSRVIILGPGDSVADCVAELNRYNRLKIVLNGPIANRQVRGNFQVDKPLDFVKVLKRATGGTVELGDRVVTISG